jgi:small subunit ribosomal protein S9
MENTGIFYTGIGKRKTSVAKSLLKEGSGTITVNNKTFEDFFASVAEERELLNPFIFVNVNNKYDVDVKVKVVGLVHNGCNPFSYCKALCNINGESSFKSKFTLRRDSRIKERRKYGLKKARKASQFSKR